MSERPKGLKDRIVDEGTRLAGKAARAVLDDRRGQEVLAAAVGAAQKGRRRVGEIQDRVLHAVGLPTKADYEDVARSMARLKRKIRELSREVEDEHDGQEEGAGEGAAEASDPSGGESPSKR
jgi:hypothetical protein